MASGILIVVFGVVVVVPVRFVERALSVPRSRFVTVKSIRQFWSVLSFLGSSNQHLGTTGYRIKKTRGKD